MRKLGSLLAALVLVVSTTTACLPWGGGTNQVTALFPDSAGLYEGNDVGVLGVTIGKVLDIVPDGDVVKVEFEFDSDVAVPADAAAVIVSRSVATDRYIELTPAYSSGEKMRAGAEIPLARTRTPVDFDEVLRAVNEFATGISGSKATSQAVRRFVRVGARAFGSNGQAMNDAITSLGTAVNGFSKQKEDFIATMASLDTLTATLVRNQSVLRGFLSSTAQTAKFLASERGNIREALTTLSRSVTVVSRYAEQNEAAFNGTLSDTAAVADILLSRKKQVGEFLELMPLVAQNLTRIAPGGQALVRAPVSSLFGGSTVQQLCQQLARNLCDLVGTDPLTPLTDLLNALQATGSTGARR